MLKNKESKSGVLFVTILFFSIVMLVVYHFPTQ